MEEGSKRGDICEGLEKGFIFAQRGKGGGNIERVNNDLSKNLYVRS